MITWPISFVRVTKIFRGSQKHLSVCHWRPERHHVVAPVVTNGGVFLRVQTRICQEVPEVSLKAYHANNKAVKYAGNMK